MVQQPGRHLSQFSMSGCIQVISARPPGYSLLFGTAPQLWQENHIEQTVLLSVPKLADTFPLDAVLSHVGIIVTIHKL